jgi:crossover junction endodeoxyribonuclease RuvC
MTTRVLGIDPGFDRIGVAILEGDGQKQALLYSECIVTDKKESHAKRLLQLGTRLGAIIEEWEPTALAIETLFFNQNVSTGIKVAEARGVILFHAALAQLSIFEYSPQAVKIAVTGYGKADKTAIESLVRKLIRLPSKEMLDDEVDAIAVGITHLATAKPV